MTKLTTLNNVVDTPQSTSEQENTRNPIIIVGMGPVGIETARLLADKNLAENILIFGDEPWHPYDRVKLSSLLAGDVNVANIANSLVDDKNLVQKFATRIVRIDREHNAVVDMSGKEWFYSKLILALGSKAHIPSIKGIDKIGVYSFRDLSHAQQLSARKARARHVVVIGGGLLGLETAKAMLRHNSKVTLIEHSNRLMPAQLDLQASDLIREHLLGIGMTVMCSTGVKEILGEASVEGIRLNNERTLDCDTVIVCTGIVPQTSLALEAGLSIGRGIKVDDHLTTNDPRIFAVGECAEHREQVIGLVAPGLEQAAVLANNIAGNPSKYVAAEAASSLKVVDVPVFSIGAVGEEEYQLDLQVYEYFCSDSQHYRKIIIRRHRIVGAMAIGEWAETPRIKEAVESNRLCFPWQLRRFSRSGLLWRAGTSDDINQWGTNTVICNCKSVRLGQLQAAYSGGCESVNALKEKTGASSVCGSCQPLLEQLVNQASSANVKSVTRGLMALLLSAGVAFLALLVWLFAPAIHPGDSITDTSTKLSVLWTDGTLKQVTGYSLLGVLLISLLVSARKRIKALKVGLVAYWRVLHTVLASLLLIMLFFHTGFSLGNEFNAILMANFLLIAAVGAMAGGAYWFEKSGNLIRAQQIKAWTSKAHIYVAWPLPVLIVFHILTVYYF